MSLFSLCCGLRLSLSLPSQRYVSFAKTLERRRSAEGNDVIVQHLQRAVRDSWIGGLSGIPEMSALNEQPRYPPRVFSAFRQMTNWLSLRFRDAPLGTIGLLLIVLSVILFPLVASIGGAEPSVRRVFSIVFFLFPPAILSALYSLFFEKSKMSGGLTVLLATIVLLVQPLLWDWLRLYVPIAGVFTIFCAVVWVLKSRSNS